MTDIVRSDRVAEELAAERGVEDPFVAAIRGAGMAMVVTDARQSDNPIIFANDAFLLLTGYEREDVIGRNCRFMQGPDTDPAAIAMMRRAVADGGLFDKIYKPK